MRIPHACLFAVLLVCTGCYTTYRESFSRDEPARVWAAMKGAAGAPSYDTGEYTERWTMRQNQVTIFEDEARIEVFRRLERVLYRPGAHPLPESRSWKLSMQLEEDDEHRPVVLFKNRDTAVAAHARNEAERYFADVADLLGREYSPEDPPRPPRRAVTHIDEETLNTLPGTGPATDQVNPE